MKIKQILLAGIWLLPLHSLAQAPPASPSTIISMNQEPHHHLVFHNQYVNVFDVKVTAGDSILLHRHNNDALAIAIGDQDLTVGIPGKADVHQKTPDGQMRLQASGYIHSTHVNGSAPYHTVAVELLQKQTGKHNLCAAVMGGQPLNCPEASANASSVNRIAQPEFASDQTRIQILRVPPHERADVGDGPNAELIVALDPSSISPSPGKGSIQILRPGDFVWLDKAGPARTLENKSDKEARFVDLEFSPIHLSNQLLSVPADRLRSGHVTTIKSQALPPRPANERF